MPPKQTDQSGKTGFTKGIVKFPSHYRARSALLYSEPLNNEVLFGVAGKAQRLGFSRRVS
jgi:hypothetical protein